MSTYMVGVILVCFSISCWSREICASWSQLLCAPWRSFFLCFFFFPNLADEILFYDLV